MEKSRELVGFIFRNNDSRAFDYCYYTFFYLDTHSFPYYLLQASRPITLKKENIQTRNRKVGSKKSIDLDEICTKSDLAWPLTPFSATDATLNSNNGSFISPVKTQNNVRSVSHHTLSLPSSSHFQSETPYSQSAFCAAFQQHHQQYQLNQHYFKQQQYPFQLQS